MRLPPAFVVATVAYVMVSSPALPSPMDFVPAALVDAVVTPLGHFGIAQFEKNRLPDWLSRWGTRMLLQKGIEEDLALAGPDGSESQSEFFRGFVADLKAGALTGPPWATRQSAETEAQTCSSLSEG